MENSTVYVTRTEDRYLIAEILLNGDIWPHVADDNQIDQPPKPELIPLAENIYWMLIKSGEDVAGLFMVHTHNSILFEVHTNVLPEHRDKSLAGCNALWKWLKQNTSMQTLITQVPKINKPARRLAQQFGFKDFGVIPSAWLKDGKLYDIQLMGATICQ